MVQPFGTTRNVVKGGLPNRKRTCTDGDPLCDADGSVNGSCSFQVSTCINVADPRLQDKDGNPVCTATDVASVTVKSPRPDDNDAAKAAAGTNLRTQLAGLAASSISGLHNEVVTYSTPITTADLCSGGAQIAVPLDGKKRRTMSLSLRTQTTPPPGATTGVVDSDSFTLKCEGP